VRWLAGCVAALLLATPALAQESRVSPVAVDSDVSFDQSVDANGNTSTGVLFDSVASLRVGPHLEAVTRPFLQRQANGEWNWQVWVAEARYERPGRVGVRVDGGLIASPVGYANLMLRPHLNPTIALPSSLFTPLPTIEPGVRATLLGAVYPYGGAVTVSGRHWDLRTAMIDTSPLRTRRIFGYENNPPEFANVVFGGGITPVVGLRIGASVTHGGWVEAGEAPSATRDRNATVVTIESEFEYRYTKFAAEWTRDGLETSNGDTRALGWFAQVHQTLAPRWFVAGRVERMTSGALAGPRTFVDQHFSGTEEVLGYRITPTITVRGGHRARRGFGSPEFAHAAEMSVVWAQRWF
jgi:hypothetical protein